MLEYKNFYQTRDGLLGLVLTDNTLGIERQSFSVSYEDGYLSENYDNLVYSWLEENDLAEIKKRTLINGPLETKIIYEDYVKYVYFPTLGRIINYEVICEGYHQETDDRSRLIQFCPHGYDYSYFIHRITDDDTADLDFIHWLHDNFSNIEFHISRYFEQERRLVMRDEQDEGGRARYRYRPFQTGHEVHFKTMDQVNLTKLTWRDLELVDYRTKTLKGSTIL